MDYLELLNKCEEKWMERGMGERECFERKKRLFRIVRRRLEDEVVWEEGGVVGATGDCNSESR